MRIIKENGIGVGQSGCGAAVAGWKLVVRARGLRDQSAVAAGAAAPGGARLWGPVGDFIPTSSLVGTFFHSPACVHQQVFLLNGTPTAVTYFPPNS